MCGINGVFSKEAISPEVVQSMTRALSHRGPDFQGTFLSPSNQVALGHTRLSIIDVSGAGHQPMHSANGRFTIVFNGEIYNFKSIRREIEQNNPQAKFTSKSDTEVILHAINCWGPQMVKRLDGMFAIAIYDNLLQKLFLFRDRVGKKPIFYFCNNTHFVFASEIKSLLRHPVVSQSKEIDNQAVHEFLHLGYIPEPKTIYRAIRKFPSGSIGEIESNLSFSIRPYWRAEDLIMKEKASTSTQSLQVEFEEKLERAVEKRLISDVPVGVFLSGGIDSSLVTAIASKFTASPIKTFNIGFKESKFSEQKYAEEVAKHLKTDHQQYMLSENDAVEMLDAYLDHIDEPFADSSTIPTMLVSKMARKQIKVALTGDGGDELFLGYGAYAWANRLSNPWFKISRGIFANTLPILRYSRFKRAARLFENVDLGNIRSHIFSQEQYLFSANEIWLHLLKQTLDFEPFQYNDSATTVNMNEEEKQAFFDLKFYLKDDLLVKTDRASMYFGLECRCPLLDQSIIAFALNGPMEIKKKKGVDKWILKQTLKKHLPNDLVDRSKWGFSIPMSQWMKNELGYLFDYLSNRNLEKTSRFNEDYVNELVTRFHNGEDYLYNRLWCLIIIQRFLLKNA